MFRTSHIPERRRQWAVMILAVVLCGVVASVLGAALCTTCLAAAADSVNESATDDDSALSHSAVPLRDRVLQEQLRRVEEMIDQREFSSAVAGLRQAAGSAAGQQILVNQAAGDWQQYCDSHSEIERLLGLLPADSLTSYRRQAEPLARLELLTAVRDSNFEMLRRLPALFPETDAARDSLRYLAAWHLDRREFAAAKAVARRLVRLPNLAGTYREAALQIMVLSAASAEAATPQSESPTNAAHGAMDQPGSQRAGASEIEVATTRVKESAVRARLFPSLSHPDWQVDSGLADEAAALTRHALHEHFEQSIPILPRARPLVIDGVVVRRSLTQVSAYELDSGRQLWASESMSESGQSASRLTMNLSLQELMAQKLAQGLQVDSLQSRLSTDGDRVFTVESGSAMMGGAFSGSSRLMQRGTYQSQTQNRIVARHLRTGELAWSLTADSVFAWLRESQPGKNDERINHPSAAEDSALEGTQRSPERKGGSFADIYFCGLPTNVDQHMVGLVQVDDLLRLYAADRATGKIEWSINIAEVPRLSPADSDWRSLDCRITLIDGVLVCPTGAGLIVGVDLGTRSVAWSRRTSRADMPLEVARLPFAPARPHRPWWQGWRDNKIMGVTTVGAESSDRKLVPAVPDSILIAAGPDTEGVVALDPQTGTRLWSLSVESPVDLISIEDRAVVLSRHAVTAVDAASGKALWAVPCREPVGTGYIVRLPVEIRQTIPKTYCAFPARGGSLIAVNCDDGTIIESVDRLESMSGCLVAAGDRLVMQNPDRLSAWTMLSAISDRRRRADNVPSQSDANDLSVDRAIDQASFERSVGMFDEAATRLERLTSESDSARVEREHAKTLLAWIRSGTLPTQRLQQVKFEAEELVGRSSIAEVIELRHAAARAAVVSGDFVLALKFYAELQSLNPSGEPRFLKPEPLRSVRHDRLIQGEVLDLLSRADASLAERLAQSLTDLTEAASSSRDPFALQRFTRQWMNLPITEQYSLDERSRIGMRYGQKQLLLLALADSAGNEVSRQASLKLIELYESRSYHRDAAGIRRGLLRLGFDNELTHGSSAAGSPWNTGSVTVSEHSEQNLDTSFIPVPVECSPGSLFDRLNVAINPRSSRNDTILRFYGDGFSGSWQTVLATSPSPLKSVGRMYRGWGIGHFLVLQLGAELFGISPFDGSGEPRVQRLWSVDMADGNRQEDHEYAPAVPGFSEEQLTMLDAFGRPIVKVGPVRAGYLCFQTRGKLVCLDTTTGQRLWQRYELPRQAICSGDGKSVFLTEPNRDRVTVLRAVDGAMVSQYSLSEAVGFQGSILKATGARVLIAERLADSDQASGTLRISKLASVDLLSASIEWSTDVDSESTVFAIDSDWLGVLSLSGQLRVISSRTGLQISTLNVQRPDVVRAIHVSSDSSSHLIALSNVAESEYLNGRGAANRSRNPSVTGQLVAVDSQTAELKWQRSVERIRFLIDQPKNAPCVALSYRRSRSAGTDATESVLHVIHRETGEDILMRRGATSASNFTFEPHADQNRLSIRMARQSIRLTFAPRVAP